MLTGWKMTHEAVHPQLQETTEKFTLAQKGLRDQRHQGSDTFAWLFQQAEADPNPV